MNVIYKLFHQDPDTREGVIAATSILGIAVNLLIALAKVLIGAVSSSIAIVSEGINNASDALTSVLALVGARLAQKHPDEKHPFGYGRVEYLAGLIIATLIMVTGIEMLISSVKLIFEPGELNISVLSLVIVAGSAVIKFLLGAYTEKMGKKVDSASLIGVGADSKGDSFASVITIAASLVFLIFHVSLDAYAGIITSLLILKAGIEVMRETVSDLLGRPGEKELAETLYKEIRKTDGIIGAADMMLHNYGPDAWSGSVNVEIDQGKTVGEIYRFLHELQLRIMVEYHVTMVFGVYAVDNDDPQIRSIRKTVSEFVRRHEHVRSYHAVYLDPASRMLYCDFIVDYQQKDWDGLRRSFTDYMTEHYPEYTLQLTIETEFV